MAREIKQLRMDLKLTQRALAGLMGVTEYSVRAWEQAQSRPSLSNLLRMGQIAVEARSSTAEYFARTAIPDDLSSALTQLGINEVRTVPLSEMPSPEPPESVLKEPLVQIPLVGRAAAGTPVIDDESIKDWFPFRKSFIEKLLRSAHPNYAAVPRLLLVRVDKRDGSSMEPTLRPGDLVLIDRGDIAPPFQRRNIYAVKMDGGITLKRITLERNRLILRPDNPEFDPSVIDIAAGETAANHIVGRVVWHASTFL